MEYLCFETLANELRVDILKQLKKKPLNVNELVEKLQVERTRVSHSLQMLKDCNFVIMTKQGKERIYALNKNSPLCSKEYATVFDAIVSHKEKNCNRCKKCAK
ncbi:MAG: metalloregulator ArsR/SmtB family transcription factor [Candidatus Woesearchaeota archaeon]|jgi:DNA-binding transcriptional ArsR family regulator